MDIQKVLHDFRFLTEEACGVLGQARFVGLVVLSKLFCESLEGSFFLFMREEGEERRPCKHEEKWFSGGA
jgi:hypothetical protein